MRKQIPNFIEGKSYRTTDGINSEILYLYHFWSHTLRTIIYKFVDNNNETVYLRCYDIDNKYSVVSNN